MITRFWQYIRKKPGLFILILILVVITGGLIKPEFYLMGWDNFSSYLNLPNNIFNTIFATWREHRGFGVPSDAESTDIFRQIFCYAVSFISPKEMVDQLYMVFMLWGGVLSMYLLGKKVSIHLGQSDSQQDLFGFIAAFFYLFNLNSLAVFYFPMIMLNTRFFMLPATILILLNFIQGRQISLRKYLFYLLILFIGFGSFMVPTVFIVLMVMLFLMFLILKKTKRMIFILLFYIFLNLFWLLPFANYTIQKSNIVPAAPTFIDITEAMLNKPKSYFSFERQAKLRPNFFESKFTNNVTNIYQPFHELAGKDETGLYRWILWIFPATYLLGIMLAIIRKRDRILIWFGATVIAFLILSMKEYSIFGPIYGFVSDHIPFANTVFRFGDTKFHAMIAFAGSIMCAFFLVELKTIFSQFTKSKIITRTFYLVLAVIIALNLFVYHNYFNGNFIGFFMYNKIPSAYFEIASIINNDPEAVRVIQLPIDSHTYWKPYSWGYFGSAFLHFMLNKPIFDRSFEPASMENASIHKKVMDILSLTATVSSDDLLDERGQELYQILRSSSIKYVIDDQTVSIDVEARNVTYWGAINSLDSSRLLSYLEKKGFLKLVKKFEVDADNYIGDYARLYPYNQKQTGHNYQPRLINLYEVINPNPRIEFLSEINKINSFQTISLSPLIKRDLGHYIQSQEYDNDSLIFPFAQTQNIKQIDNNQVRISLPMKLNHGNYLFETKNLTRGSNTNLVNIYLTKQNGVITVYLENQIVPEIEEAINISPKIYKTIDLIGQNDNYSYITIGDNVFPLDNIRDENMHYLGSIIADGLPIPVSLLYPQDIYDISSSLKQLESDPQCLHDALENPVSHITGDNRILRISGQNVSNCLTTDVALKPKDTVQSNPVSFAQLEFEVKGTSEGLPVNKYIDTGKPMLYRYVTQLPSPLIMGVCIKLEDTRVCLNKDMIFQISKENKKIVVPFITGGLSQINKLLATFDIRNSERQKYEAEVTNIYLKTYTPGIPETVENYLSGEFLNEFMLQNETEINLLVPIAKSDYTQIIDLTSDGVTIRREQSCEKQGSYQSSRYSNSGILSYIVNCKNYYTKNIPFSSNNYYLWLVAYKHLSGTLPSIVLMDKFNTNLHEKLIPVGIDANNYFSIPLQKPESILINTNMVSDKINRANIYFVGGLFEPRFDEQDYSNKEIILEHYSQNEGLLEVSKIDLINLPNYWQNSLICPKDYTPLKFGTQNDVLTYKKILPSLWQVNVNSQKGEKMILFNEQYDKQWKIINAKTLSHDRCDGYVNCYKILLQDGITNFYIFYIPEILNLFGSIVTVITIIAGLFFITNKQSH